jgi:predicted Rossmann-fold nucleotide-binding protein
MLLLRPDVVIAFPGGAGTADMVRAATAAGVKVWQPAEKVMAAHAD